ncbi:MAG TPA: hypothetical protein PKO15_15970 [Fibrobacteria bacterium]|nr:hypothetical protein [Fibrobacteria bacterium]
MLTRFHLAYLGSLSALSLCALGLVACQNTTIIEEENPRTAGDHYVHFRVADRASLPDSIWYHSSLDSGTCPFSIGQEGKEFRVHLLPYLQPMDSRDSLAIHVFRLGVHLGTYQAKELSYRELGTNRGRLNAADSLGIALFSVFDSLNAADTTFAKGADTSKTARRFKFHRIASECIHMGHPKLDRYRRVHPVGLDTSDILRQVLGLASTSNLTLGESVSRWHLGMDYPSARAALVSLGLDSLSSNPFRVEAPWKLESLHQGESFAEMKGSLFGRKGIQRLHVSVWTDSGDKSQGFIFSDLPDLKSNPQRIDLSGRKILATRPGTPTGSYRIQMIVEDSIGNQQSYQVPFRVEGPLDHRGPSIRWISPRANHVREYSDSLVAVRVEATDSSGIDKVFIGDSLATDSSGISRSSWIVPVSELGTTLRVRALDKAGNQTDSTLVLTRRAKPQPEGPALELIKPIMGSMVRTEEDSTEILWKATLTNGTVDSVWIQDRPARKDAQGAWSLQVSLPSTGKPIVVPVRARGSNGLESRNFVQVGRHRDTIGPVLSWGSPVHLSTSRHSASLGSSVRKY